MRHIPKQLEILGKLSLNLYCQLRKRYLMQPADTTICKENEEQQHAKYIQQNRMHKSLSFVDCVLRMSSRVVHRFHET